VWAYFGYTKFFKNYAPYRVDECGDPFHQQPHLDFGRLGVVPTSLNKLKIKVMNIVLKTREELGLTASTPSESGIAKDLFKGLKYILNVRKDKRPSVTFINETDNTSITVCVEKDLVEPVRTGKITINHLLGFTVLRGDNDGLYFIAPKVRALGDVDTTEVVELEAVTYNELAGY
jgi:hypothetical protein